MPGFRAMQAWVFWKSGRTKVEGWTVHLLWATALVYIIARGPGVLSLDHLLKPARS